MDKKIRELLSESQEKLEQIKTKADLEKIYVELFGKNSPLNSLTKKISTLDPILRPRAGQQINQAKKELEKLFEEAKAKLSTLNSQLSTSIDVTAPGKKTDIGHLHLVSQAIEEIANNF